MRREFYGGRLMIIGGIAAAALVALVTPAPAGEKRPASVLDMERGGHRHDAPDVKVILPAERELKAERPDVRQHQIYGGSGNAGPALGKVTMVGGKVREVHYRPGVGAHHLALVPS